MKHKQHQKSPSNSLFIKHFSRQQSVALWKNVARNLGIKVLSAEEVLAAHSKYKPHQGRKEIAKALKRAAQNQGKLNDLQHPPDIQRTGDERIERIEDKNNNEAEPRESTDKIS